MRFSLCVFLAGLLATGSALAAVQTGNEISVNPVAGGSSGTLLYPGGQYMRVVRPLLQPGEKAGAVQLHMPGQGSARMRTARAPSASSPPVRTAVGAPRALLPPPLCRVGVWRVWRVRRASEEREFRFDLSELKRSAAGAAQTAIPQPHTHAKKTLTSADLRPCSMLAPKEAVFTLREDVMRRSPALEAAPKARRAGCAMRCRGNTAAGVPRYGAW